MFDLIERIRLRASQLLAPERADATAGPPRLLPLGADAKIADLARRFELPTLAVEALLCLAAFEYEPYLRLLQRTVQREGGPPWLELGTIADLLGLRPHELPELERLFGPREALSRFALVRVEGIGEWPAALVRAKLARRVAQLLGGIDELPPNVERRKPRTQLARSLVPEATSRMAVERTRRALAQNEGIAVLLSGPAGKRHFAEGVAAALELPLVIVDLATAGERLSEAIATGRREARLVGGLLCLAHLDRHLPSSDAIYNGEEAPPREPVRVLSPALADLFSTLCGPVFITSATRDPLVEHAAPRLFTVEVPFPSPAQRACLLEDALRRRTIDTAELPLSAWGRRFALDPAGLEAAATEAVELADRRDGVVGTTDVVAACRRQLRHDLSRIAERVTSDHRWEDLVVPEDVVVTLREMIAYARHGGRVYDDWGFGGRSASQGISALFSGPPGTGKTMCAAVMARELDMELFRVDVARVVSKWIGETEKNLSRLFDEAEKSNAILLFDEADSLFTKRTEVKTSTDRYANLEVNFLLQRVESFSGVSILTSNLEDAIDTAFKRRLTFRLRFEKPDAAARATLWQKAFPRSAALAADVSFEKLGAMLEMSGGNIRNAAIRAAFLAADAGEPITMADCVTAAERECRELGQVVKSSDLGKKSNGHVNGKNGHANGKTPSFLLTSMQ